MEKDRSREREETGLTLCPMMMMTEYYGMLAWQKIIFFQCQLSILASFSAMTEGRTGDES